MTATITMMTTTTTITTITTAAPALVLCPHIFPGSLFSTLGFPPITISKPGFSRQRDTSRPCYLASKFLHLTARSKHHIL